jgi:N-acetylneuraminate synthase
MQTRAHDRGLLFLSSPFSLEAVELLESIGMAQYKIPSGEVTNLPLLDAVARTGKPVLLSSGMSSWSELDAAVAALRRHHDRISVLQCTSEYPCAYEQVGLNVMLEMRQRYGLPVGLSDHTLDNYAVFAAVTLGASVVEKHLTFSRKMYGSDARHSLEPREFAELVSGVRAIETMLSSRVDKHDVRRFARMKEIFQKSVTSRVDIPAGAILSREMLALKKPGTGIPAARLDDVLGQTAARAIPAGEVLNWSDLERTDERRVA